MSSQPLEAHSLAETYLYLMATHCPRCGQGPLRGADARPEGDERPIRLRIAATCGSCGEHGEYRFTVPGSVASLRARQAGSVAARVNPSSRPSQIIDVAQWIVLFRMIAEAASRATDKVEARRLGYEAAQCLEEALKFYEEGNDLPPDAALFQESSREMRLTNPQEFSRERLMALRGRLPTLDLMEAERFVSRRSIRREWKFWRRK